MGQWKHINNNIEIRGTLSRDSSRNEKRFVPRKKKKRHSFFQKRRCRRSWRWSFTLLLTQTFLGANVEFLTFSWSYEGCIERGIRELSPKAWQLTSAGKLVILSWKSRSFLRRLSVVPTQISKKIFIIFSTFTHRITSKYFNVRKCLNYFLSLNCTKVLWIAKLINTLESVFNFPLHLSLPLFSLLFANPEKLHTHFKLGCFSVSQLQLRRSARKIRQVIESHGRSSVRSGRASKCS